MLGKIKSRGAYPGNFPNERGTAGNRDGEVVFTWLIANWPRITHINLLEVKKNNNVEACK